MGRKSGVIALVLLISMSTSGDAAQQPEFQFGRGGSILSSDEALKAASQCSRDSPAPVNGTWTPTPNQINELEADFPTFFRQESKRWWGMTKVKSDEDADKLLSQYFRQYAGLIIGTQKIIYVNAITGWGITDDETTQIRFTKAAHICDGGTITFGVEFDPATREFNHFEFNGRI